MRNNYEIEKFIQKNTIHKIEVNIVFGTLYNNGT